MWATLEIKATSISQLAEKKLHYNKASGCKCEQLRKQVTHELKLNLAAENANITGLELQIQNDYKK